MIFSISPVLLSISGNIAPDHYHYDLHVLYKAAKGQGMPPSPSAVPGASGTPAVQRRLDIANNPVLAEGGFQHGVHRVGDFRAKTSFQAKAVLKAILKAFGYPK